MSARSGSTVVMLSLLGLVCACHTNPESLTATSSPVLTVSKGHQAQLTNGSVLGAAAQADSDAEKRPNVRGVLELRTVEWSAAQRHPQLNLPAQSPLALALDATPVPALVPELPRLFPSAAVTRGEHWYAVSMQDAEHSVYIQGARTALVLDQVHLLAAGEEVAQAPFTITRTHHIMTVSFERFGVGYGIDIECARPKQDARCNDETYARTLLGRLGIVGQASQPGGVR